MPVLTSDPTLAAVVEHSEQLAKLISELKRRESADGGVYHSSECVPASVQELVISWLGGINLVSRLACCLLVRHVFFCRRKHSS